MTSEQQYIELYSEASELIKSKSCNVMNAVRDEAFGIFRQTGFPSKKVERYKYTDVDAAFAPNYGISLSPLTIKPSAYIYNLKDAPVDATPYYHQIADHADQRRADQASFGRMEQIGEEQGCAEAADQACCISVHGMTPPIAR